MSTVCFRRDVIGGEDVRSLILSVRCAVAPHRILDVHILGERSNA